MKINCLCGEEIASGLDFFHHIRNKHEYQEINMLYDLLVKIHTMIDERENAEVRTHGLSRMLGEIQVLKELVKSSSDV